MRVLIVIDSLLPGGAELQIALLLPRLMAAGISFEIAAMSEPCTMAGEFEKMGVRVHRIHLPHRWSLLQGFSRLRFLSGGGNFQVIWAPLFFGQLYAAMLRATTRNVRLIVWLQSPGYTNSLYRGLWPSVRAYIHGLVIRRADYVVACSKAVAKDYEQSFKLTPLTVIYNAVSHDHLPPILSGAERAKIRQRYAIPSNALLLTVGARYSIDKGHSYLLRAIAILEKEFGIQVYCVAAGQGTLKAALQNEARTLGIEKRIRFEGFLKQQDLHKLMQASTLVVLPSVQEAWGLTAVEGMALGIPTVVTNYYGLAEVAAGGAAFVCLPADPTDLAHAIRRALTDETARQSVAKVAQMRVEQELTVAKIAGQWLQVLKRT